MDFAGCGIELVVHRCFVHKCFQYFLFVSLCLHLENWLKSLQLNNLLRAILCCTQHLTNLWPWHWQARQNSAKFELVESHCALIVERGLTIIDYM